MALSDTTLYQSLILATSAGTSYMARFPGAASSPLREILEGTTILDPKETPAWSFLNKEDTPTIEYNWLTDVYATINPYSVSGSNDGAMTSATDASATNYAAKPEGATFTFNTPTQRKLLRNCTEIRWKGIKVARTVNTVARKGGFVDTRDEFANQIAKKFVETGRDISASCFVHGSGNYTSASAAGAGGDAPITRITGKMRGYLAYSVGPTTSADHLTDASAGSLVTTFNPDVHIAARKKMDRTGAVADAMWVGTGTKMDISALVFGWGKPTTVDQLIPSSANSTTNAGLDATRGANLYRETVTATGANTSAGAALAVVPSPAYDRYKINIDRAQRVLGGVVDVIEDDLGSLMLFRDRWLNVGIWNYTNTSGAAAGTSCAAYGAAPGYWLFDRQKVKITLLDDLQYKPVPSIGDYEAGVVVLEFGTKVLHPDALHFVYNVADPR